VPGELSGPSVGPDGWADGWSVDGRLSCAVPADQAVEPLLAAELQPAAVATATAPATARPQTL